MFYLRARNRVSGFCKLSSTHIQKIGCLVLVNVFQEAMKIFEQVTLIEGVFLNLFQLSIKLEIIYI